jgi:hypothetical protein
MGHPVRDARYLRALRQSPDARGQAIAAGELGRLAITAGRATSVDSAIVAGAFASEETVRRLQAMIVAASLAEIGDETTTGRAVAALAAYVNPDSAVTHYASRPVWWLGWLVGAHHATAGDTAIALRWINAIRMFPPGGEPEDFPLALEADLRARLAARSGQLARALQEARTAYGIWTLHSESQLESMPEPLLRFHLATLLLRAGERQEAQALLSSLVPPTTWMGALTARASFELGELARAAGDERAAIVHYARSRELWDDAGPGATRWLAAVTERMAGS